ncbi:hydroxymethylbilane synthase [Robiginitalea myxolifaciens]|uniref:Hydroxymethylbilane synthase n=1 Tax=Robiginitalea myxolifaciens TaxID=400055 RepID=A0A1I6G0E5_9FLAO|nr:hydroxymethylbilane synthase [Robiginitalea myxolifaciens]SFR35658.1 hydroxymethylbilane synthase [Robiginitalea myxolifaciens]
MSRLLKIGTRDSALALWQARKVQEELKQHGYPSELVPVKSTGDLILDKPLYELGITGIFTKTLDVALLAGQIDLAVHSLKDVPTALPKGIIQAAVLPRGTIEDVLVRKNTPGNQRHGVVATGSLRRKAQWLRKYPGDRIENLRGNVQTRLQKLEDSAWDGAIFAAAGLERLEIKPEHLEVLDWMLPAPAQGALMVAVREDAPQVFEQVRNLNHLPSELCVGIERYFLRGLEGGCTAPIGALARIKKNEILFTGGVFSLDGRDVSTIEERSLIPEDILTGVGPLEEYSQQVQAYAKILGEQYARTTLEAGGAAIMETLRNALDQ